MGSVGLRPVEVVVLNPERAAQAQLVVHQPHRLVKGDVLHIVVEEIASHRVEPGVDAPVFDAGDDRRGELIIEARFESLEVRCRSVDRDQAVSQSEPAVADGVERGGYPVFGVETVRPVEGEHQLRGDGKARSQPESDILLGRRHAGLDNGERVEVFRAVADTYNRKVDKAVLRSVAHLGGPAGAGHLGHRVGHGQVVRRVLIELTVHRA